MDDVGALLHTLLDEGIQLPWNERMMIAWIGLVLHYIPYTKQVHTSQECMLLARIGRTMPHTLRITHHIHDFYPMSFPSLWDPSLFEVYQEMMKQDCFPKNPLLIHQLICEHASYNTLDFFYKTLRPFLCSFVRFCPKKPLFI